MCRKHVLSDLEPYVCIDTSCKFSRAPFSQKRDWVQHLELEHGFADPTKDMTCPLCRDHISSGKAAHLARHLEEVSLTILPANAESDDESEGDSGEASDDEAGTIRQSQMQEPRPRMIRRGAGLLDELIECRFRVDPLGQLDQRDRARANEMAMDLIAPLNEHSLEEITLFMNMAFASDKLERCIAQGKDPVFVWFQNLALERLQDRAAEQRPQIPPARLWEGKAPNQLPRPKAQRPPRTTSPLEQVIEPELETAPLEVNETTTRTSEAPTQSPVQPDQHQPDEPATPPRLLECPVRPCPYRAKRKADINFHLKQAHIRIHYEDSAVPTPSTPSKMKPRLGAELTSNDIETIMMRRLRELRELRDSGSNESKKATEGIMQDEKNQQHKVAEEEEEEGEEMAPRASHWLSSRLGASVGTKELFASDGEDSDEKGPVSIRHQSELQQRREKKTAHRGVRGKGKQKAEQAIAAHETGQVVRTEEEQKAAANEVEFLRGFYALGEEVSEATVRSKAEREGMRFMQDSTDDHDS